MNVRALPFVYYRLAFLSLLTMTGFICLGTVAFAELLGIHFVETSSQVQYEAMIMSLSIVGITSLVFVSTIFYLMQERRHTVEDRRIREQAIDFPDRRQLASRRG